MNQREASAFLDERARVAREQESVREVLNTGNIAHPPVIEPRAPITDENEPGWHRRARWTAALLAVVAVVVLALAGLAQWGGVL